MRNDINMYQYYKTIHESFKEDTMVLLLVKAVVWLNPWLEEYGAGLSKPIAIISEDNESIVQIEKELRGFTQNPVEFVTLSPKKIEASIQDSSYGIVFFQFQKGRYTIDNLTQIGNACAKIVTDIGRRKTAIVFAENGIPDEYVEYFSGFIYISATDRRNIRNNRDCAQQFLRDLIECVLEERGSLMAMLKNNKMQVFDIAGWVIKALIDKDILMSEYADIYGKEIDASVEKLKDEWDRPGNSAAICDLFYEALYNASGSVKMYNRKKVPGISEEEIEQFLYYDKDYYYD